MNIIASKVIMIRSFLNGENDSFISAENASRMSDRAWEREVARASHK